MNIGRTIHFNGGRIYVHVHTFIIVRAGADELVVLHGKFFHRSLTLLVLMSSVLTIMQAITMYCNM